MEEKGQGAAPEQILNHDENLGLTGYFNDGHKRIDIVLVFKDDGSNVTKEMRLNFLMNVIQFGLEAEVEPGTMAGHRDLIFVKLHAPDAIIEEFGLYFNEKSFFKDSHLEFVNPIVNFFGVANERELIKIVRSQYPGPENYSTLERSNIVYKILLRMPFGKYKNYYGIKELVDNYIILDAFALHDGPYYIVPTQSPANMSARQVLFYEWQGMINVWKMQPIHMIHEYFGKRISYYFAFYEYFNFMLIIPSILGAVLMYRVYENEGDINRFRGYGYGLVFDTKGDEKTFMCPECRNYTLCPLIKKFAYIPEIKLLSVIDKKIVYDFGRFICIWGIFFLIPWRYRERYLSWIWEETKRNTNKLVRPEYIEPAIYTEIDKKDKKKTKASNSGLIKRIVIYMLSAAFLGLWAFQMFRFSIVIWHYPRWKRLQGDARLYVSKDGEHVNIAIGAGIYTIIVYILKMVFIMVAQKITGCENNKTFLIYDRSIALKIYAFSFISSFTILITYTYVGSVCSGYTSSHLYNFMSGYLMMNSGLGTTFDDICVTLGVITMLEHVIFRIFGFLIRSSTDYSADFDTKVPCWEREYRLQPITEYLFHKRYNDLAIQFALLTCYSMMFPVASFFLFIINVWDIRNTARHLLLECRRPLLINTSGPALWKYLMIITAFYAPMSNIAILMFQSYTFIYEYIYNIPSYYGLYEYLVVKGHINKISSTKGDLERMIKIISKHYPVPYHCFAPYEFLKSVFKVMTLIKRSLWIFFGTMIGIVLYFLLLYTIPGTSNSLEDAIRKEDRIKNKYHTRKGFAK